MGYIQEAPDQRGPVDIASNVHSQNGELLAAAKGERSGSWRAPTASTKRAIMEHPTRPTGPRLWRYATGGDWQGPRNGSLVTRFYGSTDHFRQTFPASPTFPTSAIQLLLPLRRNSNQVLVDAGQRAGVRWPTGAAAERRAAARGRRRHPRRPRLGPGAVLRKFGHPNRPARPPARLRGLRGGNGRAARPGRWTASGRMDWFQNYDGQSLTWNGSSWAPSASQPPQFGQRFFDPRVGCRASFGIIGRSMPRVSAPFASPLPTNSIAPRRWATS